ncbi:MAG: histidine kinase, partial [Bacteroidota bacterium]|nr:histidine kinase [Bacteroidota bacterium]
YKQAPAGRRQVQPQRLASGQPTPSTRGIVRLPDGRLLVGAYGGALTQAADSPNAPLRPLRVRASDGHNLPLGFDLLRTRTGQVLWAEEFRGFSWFDFRTDSLHTLPYADVRPDEKVGRATCLLEDGQGQIWGGGEAGLFRLDLPRRRVLRYATGPAARQLRQLEIIDMAEDSRRQALWLATSQGLYWLQPATGVLRRVGQPGRALPTNALFCVASAGPGRAWVGTRNEGLLLVDAQAGLLRQVSLAEGMPSNIVATVLRQPDGTVWAGTYAGLVRYAPAAQRLTVFAEAEGLVDAELNRNSAYADPATRALWFGGIGGLHRVVPAALDRQPARATARLLLTAVAEPGANPDADPVVRPLRAGRVPALRLAAGAGAFVELRLALSNLLDPAQTHYAYRIRQAGGQLLSDWLPTTQRLVLRGLPPGNYVVEARAETATGQVAANLVRVPLQVDQAWWQYPLSWALGAILLVLLTFGLFWLQGSRGRRDIRLREELAANLHDEVGALLTRVTMQAELLHELGQGPPVRLAALVSDARAAASTVRDIIWSVDAAADTLGALVDRIRDYLDATARATPLRIEVVITGVTEPNRPLSPAVRQHLYLICKEAVTNALRHAQGATALTVTLHHAHPTLELHVHNDGTPGLEAPASRTGQGTRNMRKRAKLLRAQLHAGPQATGGWKVALRVPL